MFKRYQNLKNDLAHLEKEINNKQDSLTSSINTLSSLRQNKIMDEQEREQKIENEIDRFREEMLKTIDPEFDSYKKELEYYKREEFSKFGSIKAKINNFSFVDNSDFDAELNEIKEKNSYFSNRITDKLSSDLISVYGKIFDNKEFSDSELKTMDEWLTYFDKYDNFDNVMSTAENTVQKLKPLEDKSLYFYIFFIVFALAFKFKLIIAVIVILYSFVTLYLRVREFYYLAKLASAANYFDDLQQSYIASRDSVLNGIKLELENQLTNVMNKVTNTYEEVLKNIKRKTEEKRAKVNLDFDREKFREKAEKMYESKASAIDERIEEEEERGKAIEEELKDFKNLYDDKYKEMSDLKETIKRTYEDLEPSFQAYQMLDSFFLGFDDNDEPVTFKYTGDPTLIVYNSSIPNQSKALMDTIIMMCCQIMTAMSPLTYQINVVDNLTGGAPLSAFQVTSETDSKSESVLLKTITTSLGTQELVKDLYNIYEERRVRILGSYNDIYESNEAKKSENARTESFIINMFYEYDYSVLASDEKLRQLCRIGRDLGILFIFVLDTDKIESPERTRENSTDKIYKFKPELLAKLDILKNIFSFKITDSVEIVNHTISDIKKAIKNNL